MILQIQKSMPLISISRYGKKLVLIEEDSNKGKDYNRSPKSMQCFWVWYSCLMENREKVVCKLVLMKLNPFFSLLIGNPYGQRSQGCRTILHHRTPRIQKWRLGTGQRSRHRCSIGKFIVIYLCTYHFLGYFLLY